MSVLDYYYYCPRCGHKTDKKENYMGCPNCTLKFYSNPKPCTAVLLTNSRGEYLLVERAINPKKGFWDLPGGFLEDNENIETGARRELKEELGIEVKELKYFNSYLDTYDYQDINYTTLGIVFLGKIEDDLTIHPDDDVASYKFFKPEEVPFDLLGFESMKQIFSDLNH